VAIRDIGMLAVALLLSSCGSTLPKPPSGEHPKNDYEEVPYPPPAAAPEIVPETPDERAVWVDGQWVWRARYYVWQRGGWVIPPPQTYFAPSERRYGPDGTLYFAEGVWRRTTNRERLEEPPRIIRPAATPPTQQTPEPALSP